MEKGGRIGTRGFYIAIEKDRIDRETETKGGGWTMVSPTRRERRKDDPPRERIFSISSHSRRGRSSPREDSEKSGWKKRVRRKGREEGLGTRKRRYETKDSVGFAISRDKNSRWNLTKRN